MICNGPFGNSSGKRWSATLRGSPMAWTVRAAAACRGADDPRRHLVWIAQFGKTPRCFGEIRPRVAIAVSDPFGQQVVNSSARPRLVDAERMVEAEVFYDDDDQILDRGRCVGAGVRSRAR